ncbi:MAG: ATP-binding protein [Lentisphaerae bacterium]|nr:ATP-binding protein [Lentisphaerota bacterium]
MSDFNASKKKEFEDAAVKAVECKDYKKAFACTVQAIEYTLKLAEQCGGKLACAYLDDANGLLEVAAQLKEKAAQAPQMVAADSDGAAKNGEAAGDDDSKMRLAELPKEKLADVAGMDAAKKEVLVKVIAPIKDADNASKYGLKAGGGMLLYGLPGTGKTFFAKAVAGELGMPFYVFETSKVLSKYVGESQQKLQELFDSARQNPMSVIFIDEIDAILSSRGGDNVHQTNKDLVNIILTEMDGISSGGKNPFLLIGATNYPDKVDDAALSRFRAKIEVELPNEDVRRSIIKRELLKQLSEEIKVDDNALGFLVASTNGFSGRDLVTVCTAIRENAYLGKLPRLTLEFCKANFVDNHVVSKEVAESIANFKKRIGAQ